MARATFSESWYRVSGLRVGLLPSVRVHKQIYRDQVWYVLQDACSDHFFRVQSDAYAFLAQLTPRRTVETVWLEHCERWPDSAPTQDEVIALLAQLHQNNLLFFRSVGEGEGIFERYRKTRRREKLGHLLAFMYLRIPLWDPDRWLRDHIGKLRWIFSPWMVAVWCLTLVLGVRAVLGDWDRLRGSTQGLLAPDNLIWLFAALFVLKLVHELGHAVACRRHGAPVHTIGVMFIAFMPLPYTDASMSWSLRSRWQRAVVAAAGMYVELFIAALAALVWASAAPGVVSALAFNLMIIGSISSLAFNGNPLLKFDSYYILSDLSGLPNLYQRSGQQWLYLLKRFLLGIRDAVSPARDASEWAWYLAYGAGSIAYRLVVMVIIMVYMADLSLVLGALMVLAMGWIWLIWPSIKLVRYLTGSQELRRGRARAVAICLISLGTVAAVLGAWPMPQGLRAPGVVEAAQRSTLFAATGGDLVMLAVETGDRVEAGQLLMRFRHPALQLERELAGQQIIEVRWLLRRAADGRSADLESLRERERWLLQRLDEIDARLAGLDARAPHDGVWVSAIDRERVGTAVVRGERLGTLMAPGESVFVAVVDQSRATVLFDDPLSIAEVRLAGAGDRVIPAEGLEFLPYERTELPASALGLPAGGPVPARMDAEGRMIAIEPYFELRARLGGEHLPVPDGRTGVLRVVLEPAPPLEQLVLRVRQLLQARYRI